MKIIFTVHACRIGSTPSVVHVQRVMRETAVRPTPMTATPILVKMEELVRWPFLNFTNTSLYACIILYD